MKIIISSIGRDIVKMYGDNRIMECIPTTDYIVDFIICTNESFMKSNLSIQHDDDLSFKEAEDIILKKLSKVDRQ